MLYSSKSEILQKNYITKESQKNYKQPTSMFKTKATGSDYDQGTKNNSNYSPDLDDREQITNYNSNWIMRSNSIKTSTQTPENAPKFINKGAQKKLFTIINGGHKNLQKSPKISQKTSKKPKIFEIEDEDMVNREDSFITEEFMQGEVKISGKNMNMSKLLNNNFITDSPDLTKVKLLKNYMTNSSTKLLTLQTQPCGDQEDEIVVGFSNSQDSNSF